MVSTVKTRTPQAIVAEPKFKLFDRVQVTIDGKEGEPDWHAEGYIVGAVWVWGEWEYTVDADTSLPRLISGVSNLTYMDGWRESNTDTTITLLERYNEPIAA